MNIKINNQVEREFLLALSMIPEIRSDLIHRLLEHLGSAERIWKADTKILESVNGIGPATVEYINRERIKIDPVSSWDNMIKQGIRMILHDDIEYPQSLKSIYDPPPYLFIKGEILPSDSMAIAIVGSRKASNYGLLTSKWLASELAKSGLTIISGMARGVDSYAHLGALEAKGRTIAVMGCGLDKAYPPENRSLKEKIESFGASISEYPPGSPPLAWHFPARNRIISGLSLGVIITEAGEKSGALITADMALEQGKEVFAVPGNIREKTHRGTHQLIKDGAKLVQGVEDILEELGIPIANTILNENKKISLNPDEKKVLNCVNYEGIHFEELLEKTKLPVNEVSAILMILETKRLLNRMPGNIYVRID